MAGFFSKLGKKADELAATAAEKASELKDAATEKIQDVIATDKWVYESKDEKIILSQDEMWDLFVKKGIVRKAEDDETDE